MSECKIDHSVEDVLNKLNSQKAFLPKNLSRELEVIMKHNHPSQQTLNELFHLLKKYDLASEDEQQKRNAQLSAIAIK